MPGLADNPYTALTIIVAPAVLTNASSVLSFVGSNRIARVVDRWRAITRELSALEPGTPDHARHVRQMEWMHERSACLLKAIRAFYTSVGAFAASALLSLMGALASALSAHASWFTVLGLCALGAGGVGVGGLVTGCTFMTREAALGLRALAEEADAVYGRMAPKPAAPAAGRR